MAIEITIINSPNNVDVGQSNQTFPDSGGTLGRGSDNFWVLPDPNKYMSTVHAQIACVAEQYVLTDLSTNGTFMNGGSEPIGNGNQINLQDGDRFTISDYEFIANISSARSENNLFTPNNASDPFDDFDAPNPSALVGHDEFLSAGPVNNDPFASGIQQSSSVSNVISNFADEQTDPLALLNNSQELNDPFADTLSGLDSFSQNSSAKNNGLPDMFTATTSTSIASNNAATDAINWPTANQDAGFIPDDWDDDDLLSDFAPMPSENSPFATPIAAPIPAAPIPAAPIPAAPISAAPIAAVIKPDTAPVFAATAASTVQQPSQNNAATSEVNAPAKVAPIPVPIAASPVTISQHSAADYAAIELQNQQLQQEVAQLKQQLSQAQSTALSSPKPLSTETQSIINAMGLSKWNLDDKKVAEINETVGHLMRETMQGMMRVLKFRKKIKEEFRINVTTIQSVENNPLKFSANIDDAMENMFIKENNAYKAPVDAVREGFQGIAEHQVAVIAGMQAAFRGMIDRFDPTNLENRFEKYKSSSLLSLGQKSKRWNAYKQYHQDLMDNLDDSFQHLFGYDFVQAYEEQMQRLISERLSSDNNNDNDE